MNDEDLGNLLLEEFDAHHSGNDDESRNESSSGTNARIAHIILIAVIWMEGLRSNSNVMWIPDEQNLYYRNCYNKKYEAWGYTCSWKKCNARVFAKEDGTVFKMSSTEHSYSHGSMYNKYKESIMTKMMKERCKTAPASTTVREIFNEGVIE